MASDRILSVGEALVGEGNEIAHIDLMIGSKTGPVGVAFTNALAPTFWYLVPLVLVGFVLALFLREVKLSDEAGMVARGEAVAVPTAPTV